MQSRQFSKNSSPTKQLRQQHPLVVGLSASPVKRHTIINKTHASSLLSRSSVAGMPHSSVYGAYHQVASKSSANQTSNRTGSTVGMQNTATPALSPSVRHDSDAQARDGQLTTMSVDKEAAKSGVRCSMDPSGQTSSASLLDMSVNDRAAGLGGLFNKSRLPCFSEVVEQHESPEADQGDCQPDNEAVEEKTRSTTHGVTRHSTTSTGQKGWSWFGINIKKSHPLRQKPKRAEEAHGETQQTPGTVSLTAGKSASAVAARRSLVDSPSKKILIKSPQKQHPKTFLNVSPAKRQVFKTPCKTPTKASVIVSESQAAIEKTCSPSK